METYDTKTASRIVGVSLRQLQYWDEQDFIRPSVKLADGRGSRRLYSFNDLICLKVVRDLTSHGLNLQKIRRCLKPLKQAAPRMGRAAESVKSLTDGEKLFVITDDRRQILEAMKRQFVLSLGLGRLMRQLDRQARRAEPVFARKTAKKARRLDTHGAGSA